LNLLRIAETEKHNLITIFFGANVTQAEADSIAVKIHQAYPQQELEVKEGGQPHYPFIISIED
jgi:dihydroxyacetone kinase-like predicted kinase